MGFLGMRGTGDWVANQAPENWRQMMLRLYPNGKLTLTAILSMMGSERTDHPKFHWWTKSLPDQGGTITATYTDSGLSSAYVGGTAAAAGVIVYVKVAEAVVGHFRIGHEVKLSKVGDYRYDTAGYVVSREANGASSKIGVKLIEAADATFDLDGCDRIDVIGNGNAEGATMPDAIAYDPTEFYNVTQIWRTPLSITRTARKTTLRTPDAYREAKREALEMHGIEMEKSFIWGVRYETTGSNGKPLRFTGGILRAIIDNAPGNVDNFTRNANYSGDTWLQSGEDWLDEKLEGIFRYGDTEKLGICGTGALRGINRLAKAGATISLEVKSAGYGLKVVEWVTPFGTVYLKTHPLFSHNPVNTNDILIIEPRNFKYRFIDDTRFKKDNSETENVNNSKDGTDEEYLTEAGLEWHYPETGGYLTGVGLDNVV